MNFLITTTYVVLVGLIILLLILMYYNRQKKDVDMNAALLGPDELEKHAVEVARGHVAGKKAKRLANITHRLEDNFRFITDTYKALNEDARNMLSTVPAAEWLLDNYYVIEEQVQDIKISLSKSCSSQLPILKTSYLIGYPRVYAIALELVSHADGQLDEKLIKNFIRSYQTQATLSISELWAVAIMLRIALVENIRQICEKIIESQNEWHRAEELSTLLAADTGESGGQRVETIKQWLSGQLHPSFVERLVNRLRRRGALTQDVIEYLDLKLSEENFSIEAITELEHQLQASRQISIGNSVTSLRMVSTLDWNEIFETLSHVEGVLVQDPSGVYPKMDFESRDFYRHTVEKLAKAYGISELKVARTALESAAEENRDDDRLRHVGYYLIGEGKVILKNKMGVTGMAKGLEYAIKSHSKIVYVGSIVLLAILIEIGFIYYSINSANHFFPAVVLLTGLAVLIPSIDIGITLVNYVVSLLCRPSLLPKLELRDGIPENANTMVIIPTLLPNEKRVNEILEQLEVIFLANSDPNLYFALVGDYKDAPAKSSSEDGKITSAALEGVKRLNQRYSIKGLNKFFYFHRRRQYSKAQDRWMGWERKRGAIAEFNELLRGNTRTSYSISSSDPSKLPYIKYVITLDADTNLPMGTAKKLAGTMLHPLNKAVVDRDKGVVKNGYGLIQPRISIGILSAGSTLFSRIFAGHGGIDPYTTAVSDVYQDLFGEGIFTGKGIYEVDVFEGILKNAIPENAVLSHDLLEGSYVRVGLATDIELIDGYPARYNSFAMRQHRWVRGDWQLLPWLKAHVRNRLGDSVENPLPLIARWKILDNMRRSLLSPALMLLILLGFSVLPGSSLVWVGLALLTLASPVFTHALGMLFKGDFRISGERTSSTVIHGFRALIYQTLLLFIFVPYQAYLMCDAIVKTLYRVFVSHKNMLEWVTAADMEANLKNNLKSFWRRMWISPFFGLLVFSLCTFFKPMYLPIAALLLIVWALAPAAAYKISIPFSKSIETLSGEHIQDLRDIALKTWAYFEDFAIEEDNYLPPDNFQEEPTRIVAHRTSPTNIGLLLAATVTARDFGYIGTAEMGERIANTIATIEKMEKWRGHLYNWYDTITLKVLRPLYVSTVDSGNLIAYLMVVREALKEYMKKPSVDISLAYGIRDLVNLLNEENADKELLIDPALLEDYISGGNVDIKIWNNVIGGLLSQIDVKGEELKKANARWTNKLYRALQSYKLETGDIDVEEKKNREQLEALVGRISALIDNMKFKPLFDIKRQLFAIGYNVEEGHLSKSYYDLLASEARQVSYIAIARGEVDQKHWFRLGRKLVMVDGYKGLVSWTGTMFEYLMPLLLMKNYDGTLLDETYSFVLRNQKRYGRKRNIPWGVSESGYNTFDINLNYQYKAFGIPELGLKRGLENDIVVAPYASILAVCLDPSEVMDNIRRLEDEGMKGDYGFYEAVDYTPSRLQRDRKSSVVKSFMVHHLGMSILALNNYINKNILQQRFHANPVIKSAETLLQERVPLKVTYNKEHMEAFIPPLKVREEDTEIIRTFETPNLLKPDMHILSNGSYSVMVAGGGSGYSKLHDMAVTRWFKEIRGKVSGMFIFVRNINSNDVWSAYFEPLNEEPEEYNVKFSPDKAEFIRRDGNIETHTQITVSPEDNAEVRRVSLTNFSDHVRELEVTSYFEIVLTQPEADIAHPAFSNLFIRTEFLREYDSLLASRRPRLEGHNTTWGVHTVAVEGDTVGDIQFETDRMKFIGRNRNLSSPLALDVNQPLSNTEGAVLDPVMSLRRRVRVEPGRTASISFITAAADNRKKALELADKYRDPRAANRAFELAWTRSRIEADFLGISAKDAETYLKMVPIILLPSENRRAWADIIIKSRKSQQDLWPFGISGDVPLVLLSITSSDEMDMVFWILKAHEFWRVKGLMVDLVILVEDESSYTQPLQDAIKDAVTASHARDIQDKRGGVFIRNAVLMSEEDRILFYTVARVVLRGDSGSVEEQLKKDVDEISLEELMSFDVSKGASERSTDIMRSYDSSDMRFFNGLGGFNTEGGEYVIHLREGQHTPAPWTNIIANKSFGFQVTEAGGGYTWSENSRENKLTPWSNDPVSDPPGEIFYVRDDQNGSIWTLTPSPVRQKAAYTIKHGHGYSVFEHTSHGIEQKLTELAAVEDPVKLCIVNLKNLDEGQRSLTFTYYIRPVLGVSDQVTSQFITTERLKGTGTLLVRNDYNSEFGGRIAFLDVSEKERYVTCDRSEFLGKDASLSSPEGLRRKKLSGRVGAGYDPCAAIQVSISLKEGEEKKIVFLLGQCSNTGEIVRITKKYTKVIEAENELARVREFWKAKLQTIQVSTPDESMDLLLNRWYLYQVISCRLWSRSAFYQSGGAYGFRDQLQDVMAVTYSWPELTRRQILLHSEHQFVEGDVQHWWHAETGKGIRTRYSDDLVWLAYVTADYVEATDDWSVLDEVVPYLESEPLKEGEDERYEVPSVSKQESSVYEHCLRAIDHSLKFGVHGIPLMGCGDWNDGMNTVGNKGKGESVWLGWFVYTVLGKFVPICRTRGDDINAERYVQTAKKIAESIEKNAWDGSWYRRAYFDDGTPLGSKQNPECSIDSIAQSWSAISGAGKETRVMEAMNAVDKYLIDKDHGIIKLLTPPFDNSELHPGYIKGYVPGVRENGGQYTHAAVWVLFAYAKLGMGEKAWEIFHLINPINHTRTPIEYNRYKQEPYVIAADVYAVSPHIGRGGWSWYTGAAGWVYRVGIEYILGFKKRGKRLLLEPCIPAQWDEYKIKYSYENTTYNIHVLNPKGVEKGVASVSLDGVMCDNGMVDLANDGAEHSVEVIMG